MSFADPNAHATAARSATMAAAMSALMLQRGVSPATTSIGMPTRATISSAFDGMSVIPASSGDASFSIVDGVRGMTPRGTTRAVR